MNAGTPCPYNGLIGDAAKEAWEADQLTGEVKMVSNLEEDGALNEKRNKGAGAVAGLFGLLLLL